MGYYITLLATVYALITCVGVFLWYKDVLVLECEGIPLSNTNIAILHQMASYVAWPMLANT